MKAIVKSALIMPLLIIFLLTATVVESQEVKADSSKFAIGSKVNLTLEYRLKGNEKVNWPVIGDTITKSIEVLSKSKIDTLTDEKTGIKVLRQQIAITSFDTGFLVIPPIPFGLANGGNQTATEPLLLEVYKIKVNPTADIKDIKPVIKAPVTFREVLPWLIGLLLLAAIVYGIFYYLRRRKQRPVEQPKPKVTVPSWEIALSQLEILRNEKLWQQGEVKKLLYKSNRYPA